MAPINMELFAKPLISPPTLQINLLGVMEARLHGERLPPVRTRKDLWLLALLVMHHPNPLPRSFLAATLWPDSEHETSLQNLRKSLNSLRNALGEAASCLTGPPCHTLKLDLTGVGVDLIAFDAAIAAGDPASLERAVALYRGPLLEGCYEEWATGPRLAREQSYLQALEQLANAALAQGESRQAVAYLRRVIGIEALRESAYRLLMQAYAQGGDYASCVGVYRELRMLLQDQVQSQPDAQTRAVYEQLRREAHQRAHTLFPVAPPAGSAIVRSLPRWPDAGQDRHSLEESQQEIEIGRDVIVTLLFTDIEGSTRLWEQHPQAMRLALMRHDMLLRAAIEEAGGEVFKTVGDAFCAVFATASAALHAAMEAQLALWSEQWPSELALKVRMALHTGEVERREGDCFGQTVNRVASLLNLGHGGQTLLSGVTRALLGSHLPEGVSFRESGRHRLKGMEELTQVYELLHPDLTSTCAGLRSRESLPNNLPRRLSSFIGREREKAEVKRQLAGTSLLTLTGSGGCGKTRLALEVAEEMLAEYPDGVWLVELAPLSDPSLVAQRVAQALSVREEVQRPISATLMDSLRNKTALVVLDNCEHLLEACAQLCELLLGSCAGLTLLLTSREALHTAGEQTYRVPSLRLPDRLDLPGGENDLEGLLRFDAVRLFVERASRQRSDFQLSRQNAGAVTSVCRRLDGIPLAIELAAARVRSLTVNQIEERLSQRFRLLADGGRTAISRHQTLQAMIDWSYDLLSREERALLARLSVFAGGWSLEAAEQVCTLAGKEESQNGQSALLQNDVLSVLTGLVDKSLVVYLEREGEGRYQLLETTRQYARERLAVAGEEALWGVHHRDYFLALAEQAYENRFSASGPLLMEMLEREHDNCRAALELCAASFDAEAHLRLAGALGQFWGMRGHFQEGRAHLDLALARRDAQELTAARARAKCGSEYRTLSKRRRCSEVDVSGERQDLARAGRDSAPGSGIEQSRDARTRTGPLRSCACLFC